MILTQRTMNSEISQTIIIIFKALRDMYIKFKNRVYKILSKTQILNKQL